MNIKKLLSDNMPVILTAVGVTGVASTAILAVRATPNALRDIWDAESEFDRALTNLEKVRLAWHHYIPSAIVGTLTVSSILGLNSVSSKRQAALASLYSITDRAFTEYKEKVTEIIGEKKSEAVQAEIAEERLAEDPVSTSQVIVTGKGEHLCYDSISGRYFKSDIESIRKAQNDVNAQCLNDVYASQNDFYRAIGLPPNAFGEELGWRSDHLLDISFSSHLADDGTPCLSLDYRLGPIRGYYKGF